MISFRLKIAREYLLDAQRLLKEDRFNSSASRAYYAAYQCMWAALGEPREGKIWRHLAIINHFVRGYWHDPQISPTGPGLFEEKRLPLRRLYAYRIQSDYDGISLDAQPLGSLLETVDEMIAIVQKKG
jgi:uncharacterized protein (UPF0332 family)